MISSGLFSKEGELAKDPSVATTVEVARTSAGDTPMLDSADRHRSPLVNTDNRPVMNNENSTPSPPARDSSTARRLNDGSVSSTPDCSQGAKDKEKLRGGQDLKLGRNSNNGVSAASPRAPPPTTTAMGNRPTPVTRNTNAPAAANEDDEVEIIDSKSPSGGSVAPAQHSPSEREKPAPSRISTIIPQEKKLRQTTLTFAGLSKGPPMAERLAEKDKLISDLEAQLQQMRDEKDQMRDEIEGLSHENATLKERREQEVDRFSRYQTTMREAMVEQGRTMRRDARRKQHNLHFELGQVSTMQTPNGVQEMWVHGNRYREIINECKAINERLNVVEQGKKEAQQSKRVTSSKLKKQENAGQSTGAMVAAGNQDPDESSNGFAHPLPMGTAGCHMSDYLHAEEMTDIHKLEVVQLKAQLEVLEKEKKDMEIQRVVFLKECRRIEDEDHSVYASAEAIGPKDEPHRYVLMCLLGKGGFSEVWKGFDLKEGQFVALKIHHIDRNWAAEVRNNYCRHLERELEIMKKLDHPRFIHFHGFFQLSDDGNTYVSVMEQCGGTDLDTHLKKLKTLKESDAKLIIKQVISGIRKLHDPQVDVIHYDLKPANILFASDLASCIEIKITDFGLSKLVQREGNTNQADIELTSQGTGTFWYLPPECFGRNKPRITNKVDIWAIGVIFYQLVVGRKPFAEGESQMSILKHDLITSAVRSATAQGLFWPPDIKISAGCKQFIQECLTERLDKRPDINQLSNHPYFVGERKRPRMRALLDVNTAPTTTGQSVSAQKGAEAPETPTASDVPPLQAPALRTGTYHP